MTYSMSLLALLTLFLISPISFADSSRHYIASYEDAYLEEIHGLPVLHLRGTQEQMGIQYGYLLGDRIEQAIDLVHHITQHERPLSSLPGWMIGPIQKFIGLAFWTQFSDDDKDFLDGILDGAKKRDPKIDLGKYELSFLNSLVDIAAIVHNDEEDDPTHPFESKKTILNTLGLGWLNMNCDSFAAWGPRTIGGKTFQTRNTDVKVGLGLESFPLIIVYKPKNRIPYISAGFVGQFGVFTGLNAYGLGIGQVWAFSKEKKLGTPWSLQMREVFSRATTPAEALDIFKNLEHRTYGNNFVFANASGNGLVAETTPSEFEVFTADDPREDLAVWNGNPYGIRIPYTVFRADTALNPKIRSGQTASNGPNGDPRQAEAYQLRYKGQADKILQYEKLNQLIGKEEAETISRETAIREGSLQAAVYANTDRELWISYAQVLEDGSIQQAYQGEYKHIPFSEFLPTLDLRQMADQKEHLLVKPWNQNQKNQNLELRIIRNQKTLALQEISLPQIYEKDLGNLESLSIEKGDLLELRYPAHDTIADRLLVQ